MHPAALYAYAVLPEGATAPPAATAILPGATVSVVADAGLAVLVSTVPRGLFEAGEECRMADPAWVAERASAHHGMVAAAALAGPVLPLAFGALFSDVAPLRAWLRGSAAALGEALREVAGCEEWSLTLTEDVARHDAWLTAHDTRLQHLAAQAAAAPEGTAFLLERRRERALAGIRAERRQTIAATAAEALAGHARCLELAAPAADRIGSWTALLPIAERDALRDSIAAVARAVADTGLHLALSGPWPPYAFARGALRHAG